MNKYFVLIILCLFSFHRINSFESLPSEFLKEIRDNLNNLHNFKHTFNPEIDAKNNHYFTRKLEQTGLVLSSARSQELETQKSECIALHNSLEQVFEICFGIFEQVICLEVNNLDFLCDHQCLSETLNAHSRYSLNNCSRFETPYMEVEQNAIIPFRPKCSFNRDCCGQFLCVSGTCQPRVEFTSHPLKVDSNDGVPNNGTHLFYPAKALLFFEFLCAKEDSSGAYCFPMFKGSPDFYQCSRARGLGCCLGTYNHFVNNCLQVNISELNIPNQGRMEDWMSQCDIPDSICRNVDLSKSGSDCNPFGGFNSGNLLFYRSQFAALVVFAIMLLIR
uniref:Uncharacterized protein n=1 Tax=Polyblepharides amylifera TaxID=1486889 RepID=A0A7R9XNK2_9CHLO|mmetsp:Transcript_1149/g.1611  ORF Transcript_1149/g.1611 Transcript_1149/m.1611 type:complete len:333 (+) Transcript_1149:58-1056(+)